MRNNPSHNKLADLDISSFDKEEKLPEEKISIGVRIIFLIVGLVISGFIYSWLKCSTCNTIVIMYFSIIGLACFAICGLPVEMILSSGLIKND
jgi:hypothetical protein